MTATVQQNKDVFSDFQKSLNRQDWSVRAPSRYLKPDVIDRMAPSGDMPGIEFVHRRLTTWRAAFADATEVNLAMVGEKDVLSVLYETRARHAGTYMGIPATNRPVRIPGIKFARFEDGLIAKFWGVHDFQETASEIGAALTLTPRGFELPAIPKHPHARFVAPEIRQ